jgi:tetratricopeptide (TPR) repeat protein
MTSADPQRSREAWLRAAGAVAIAAAVAVTFWPALRGTWIWDDLSEVTANPALRDASGLRRIWLAPPGPDYLPLKSTVQWVEWRLWGMDATGWHAVNLALHAAGALLAWRLFAVLGSRAAFLGGVLFAVHPMAVESVAWVSEQKNTLALPLLLMSVLAYLRFDRRPAARAAYGSSLGLFAASMLCKVSGAMLPFCLLLHAWWRRGRVGRSDLARTAPFFAVSLVLGAIAVRFQFAVAIGQAHIAAGGPAARAALAGRALVFYLGKLFAPVGLMPLYPAWKPGGIAPILCWISAGAAAAWFWSRRDGSPAVRGAILGLGFIALNLVPILGFVPLSFMRMAWVSDHFAYVPLVGAAGLAAGGAGWIAGRIARPAAWAAGAGTAILAGALALECRAYCRVFQDSGTLWAFAARANPASAAARYNHANALVLEGRPAEALPEFEAALAIDPSLAEARSNYGDALQRLGRADEALAQYRLAIGEDPGLVLARVKAADIDLAKGLADRAISEYEAAVRIRPGYVPALADLAYALARAGRLPEAEARYREALKLEPGGAEAWDELGTVLVLEGRPAEAVPDYEEALRLRPDSADTRNNLGLALGQLGRTDEAIRQFEAALKARPDFPLARANLELARKARIGEPAPQTDR